MKEYKFNNPFRITVEHYDEKIIIEKDHSDIDFGEYMGMLKKLTSVIFNEKLWNDYFEED